MKKLTLILILCLLVGSLNGCGIVGSIAGNIAGDVINDVMSDTTKTFTLDGVTLQGPSNLEDMSDEDEFQGFHFALANDEVAIIGLKESFVDFGNIGQMILADYTQLILEANEFDVTVNEGDGYQYFIYEGSNEGMDFKYLGATFQGSDAFWFIQVYSLASDFDETTFLSYLDTVELT